LRLLLTPNDIAQLQYDVAYKRDERAYKQLFIFFYPQLFRFASQIINNVEASEEIVLDVMMRIWEMESRLGEVSNLKVYLFKAIKNSSLTYLSSKKVSLIELDEINSKETSSYNPDQNLLDLELKEYINNAVQSLPHKCKWVYRLIKEEGFTYKEASAVLNVSINTIENHMAIAFKRISQHLHRYLKENE
jgi:RNA polymerase sigma-70 factor (ECF subfamily)